ncbi:MAG: RIP metalloprotease RseP [Gallionella sp.]
MITLLAFVGAIGLLVVFHEFGHYWVARRCGVKVLRFSVGFGKVIYSKRFANNSTEWVVSAIPLGGYVKMVDEREGEVVAEDIQYAFNRKPVLQRMAIVVAGPLANFLLAIVLYWATFVYGVPGLKPVLGDVPLGSPAAFAQLQTGQTIISINGETIASWQELRWRLLELSLRQAEVNIETRSADGVVKSHMLDVSSLEANDMEGEFLDKVGLHLYQPVILPVVGNVVVGSVAQLAGLKEGDQILRANYVEMDSWSDFVDVVRSHPEQTIQLQVKRGEITLNIAVVPQAIVESGKTVGKIGMAPKIDREEWQAMLIEMNYAPDEAFVRSLRKTWETSVISLKMLSKMVLGEVSMKNISGPITIADYAGQSAVMGVTAYLGFLALVSISLGILNLLPIPLLDGGHLLYYVAELVKGSPVSEQAWENGQKIGIALLGTLMVFAIYNDINRLVSG